MLNWAAFAMKLPMIISGTMAIVQKIKSASGSEKKKAVIEAIPDSISLIEYAAEKNIINDPVVADLISVYIDAEKIALRAREALKAGILERAGQQAEDGGTQ